MSIDQPRVSDLRRGRLERISVARLIRWLDAMGYDVRVAVEPGKPKRSTARERSAPSPG